MNHTIIAIVSGLVILAGIAGSILPFLPGSPLAFVGLLLYAIVTGFETTSATALIILGVLTLLNIGFDLFGPALATRGYKSSKQATTGALIGGLLGITVFAPFWGPIGLFVGPFVGAFIGEYLAVQDKAKALKAARAALIGIVAGTIFQLIVSISILSYFLVAVFRY